MTDALHRLQRQLGFPVGVTPDGWCTGPCPVCDDIPRYLALAYAAVTLANWPTRVGQATLQEVVVGP